MDDLRIKRLEQELDYGLTRRGCCEIGFTR